MEKRKENLFLDKFRLLNSQEHTEEINWSSSGSSEFENVLNKERISKSSSKVQTRKRKRKKKSLKNISNLDVTILDTHKDHKEDEDREKSPILAIKSEVKSFESSPIITPTPMIFPPYKCAKKESTSPILSFKVSQKSSKHRMGEKSPIFLLKRNSPNVSPKIRKKLFKLDQHEKRSEVLKVDKQYKSSNEEAQVLDRRKSENISIKETDYTKLKRQELKKSLSNLSHNNIVNEEHAIKKEIEIKEEVIIKDSQEYSQNEPIDLDNTYVMLKTSNSDLVQRIKSYFDSHFSSETPSQHSINESLTPNHNSKTSDEIEIMTFPTQLNSNRTSSASEQDILSKNPSPASSHSAEILNKTKKIRYKKDGMAHRLNALLKKHNANISLWQHERFLAENSNFVIPKGEHLMFRIQTVSFKYGCYLIEGVDIEDCNFLILINNVYVKNVNIAADMVLKVYEPYEKVDLSDNCILIINVCKFECLDLQEQR